MQENFFQTILNTVKSWLPQDFQFSDLLPQNWLPPELLPENWLPQDFRFQDLLTREYLPVLLLGFGVLLLIFCIIWIIVQHCAAKRRRQGKPRRKRKGRPADAAVVLVQLNRPVETIETVGKLDDDVAGQLALRTQTLHRRNGGLRCPERTRSTDAVVRVVAVRRHIDRRRTFRLARQMIASRNEQSAGNGGSPHQFHPLHHDQLFSLTSRQCGTARAEARSR